LRHRAPALTLSADLNTAAQTTADTANTNGAFASEPTLGENTAQTSKAGDDTFGSNPFWDGASTQWYQ